MLQLILIYSAFEVSINFLLDKIRFLFIIQFNLNLLFLVTYLAKQVSLRINFNNALLCQVSLVNMHFNSIRAFW